jgi:large subunit ribosomal protein L18
MDKNAAKQLKRSRRRTKIRFKVRGTKERPRLSVHKSNKNFYLQLIDDVNGKTLASAHSREIKSKSGKRTGEKTGGKEKRGIEATGFELGKLLARKAGEKKIGGAVFDRGGYRYHGGVKAVADGAREGGLRL